MVVGDVGQHGADQVHLVHDADQPPVRTTTGPDAGRPASSATPPAGGGVRLQGDRAVVITSATVPCGRGRAGA